MNPLITTLGTQRTKRPKRKTAAAISSRPVSNNTRLINRSGSAMGCSASKPPVTALTSRIVTAVIGAVGPEHWTRVPPSAAVIRAITPADRMPAKAPRPLKTPNAAPRLMATKLTVNPANSWRASCRVDTTPVECFGNFNFRLDYYYWFHSLYYVE